MSETTPLEPALDHVYAQRALKMGIATWLSNAGGCLLGMVPLALPLSVVLVGVTVIMGVVAAAFAMWSWRLSARADKPRLKDARVGFWLGMSHLILSFIVALGAWLILSGRVVL